jgi:hypothetical protein
VKNSKPFPLVELAILAFCAWLSRDLLNAWRHSPHDKFGWLALLIWLVPVVVSQARQGRNSANVFFLGAAIVMGAFGDLSEFHFLGHVALAFSIAAWLPVTLGSVVWLVTALAWMPVFGWQTAHFSDGSILFLRLALVLAGNVCWRVFSKKSAIP